MPGTVTSCSAEASSELRDLGEDTVALYQSSTPITGDPRATETQAAG
jgi:hypothetical protein